LAASLTSDQLTSMDFNIIPKLVVSGKLFALIPVNAYNQEFAQFL